MFDLNPHFRVSCLQNWQCANAHGRAILLSTS